MFSQRTSIRARRSARFLEETEDNRKFLHAAPSAPPSQATSVKRCRSVSHDNCSKLEPLDLARNSSGFLSLPRELIDEILSYIPIFEPSPYNHLKPLDAKETMDQRRCVLRALSQTCKSLRGLTVHSAWERIEVVSTNFTYSRRWKRDLAEQLLRQLECAVRDPMLREQVQEVIFIWTGSSRLTAPKLAEYLSQLPNLEALQILGPGGDYKHFESAFEKYTLSEVRHLTIPVSLRPVLRSCPRLHSLKVFWYPDYPRWDSRRNKIISELQRDSIQYCIGLSDAEGCGNQFTERIRLARELKRH